MRVFQVGEDEDTFLNRSLDMRRSCEGLLESKNRDELADENDESDRCDKAAEERLRNNFVGEG